ncbi:DUF2231 domain-containing protein [Micromonospora sp. NPDC049679]|uniref:DUF2231 domain-containing protein n=1 Tax=Micromonospora sp. NPDC049679 TaxID=3155920 RepID=UPI0033D57F35
MESRLSVSGHPIQPMLVTFPVGLFVSAVLLDVGALAGGSVFSLLGDVAYWSIIAGLGAAALTALAGMVDLWDRPIRGPRRTLAAFNLATVGMAALFVLVCLARAGAPHHVTSGALLVVEFAALVVGGIGVRLGTRLVREMDEEPVAEPTGRRPVPTARRGGRVYKSRRQFVR